MLAFFAVPAVTAVGMVGLPGAATAGTSSTFVTGIDRPGVQEPLFIATDPNLGLVWVTSKEATRALYELSATTANVLASVDLAGAIGEIASTPRPRQCGRHGG